MNVWNIILDIFFPPICLNCRRHLERAEKQNQICSACFDAIELNKTLFYPSPDFVLGAAASYEDKAVRNLIHYFKYNYFLNLQRPLIELLTLYLENLKLNLAEFTVVPVPLHGSKLRKRGFNQSEILAEAISKKFGIVLDTKILRRIKDTKPQIKVKNYKERAENIKNAFEITDKNKVKGKKIILIDDVYTSGATVKEAVKTLKKAGVNKTIALVVAKA